MLKIQGRADTKRGGEITAIAEWDVWDIVLDDDDTTAVPNLTSLAEPTIVSTEETASDVWTVTFSEGTVVTSLAKTGAPGITSATVDAGEDSGVWEVTLASKGHVSGFDEDTPVVGGWLVFCINDEDTPSTGFTPVWEYVSAVEFTKYLVVQGG